jgi:glycosyltransferase involved in cell wall biosynthesis
MRILRIIARLNIGGPAIQAILLSGHDVEPEYRSKLVCGHVGPSEGDMSYLAEQKGIKPIIIPELGREISPWKDLSSFLALRRLIRNQQPEIVHTHTAKAGTLGRLAIFSLNLARPKYRKIKAVHTFHGHVFHSYFGRFKSIAFRLIERWLARGTDRIVVLSDSQHRDIVSKFRIANSERVRIVPLGFDLSPFGECDKHRHKIHSRILPRDDLFCLGMIGRLTAVKNINLLLDAMAELKNQGYLSGFYFLIIGDGEQRRELEQRALTLDIVNHITFTGWQRDLAPFYSALDGVVLTSRNEGTPVALIEAMAAGKPIIATKVGGVMDLLGPNVNGKEGGFVLAPRGILIPSGDAPALAKAMIYLKKKNDTVSPMVARARDFVMKNFSKERLINDICSLYQELIPGDG